MNIGIDLRPLLSSVRTGVGEYTVELLNAVFALPSSHDFFLFSNSWRDGVIQPQEWKKENIHFVSKHFPSKLLNSSLYLFQFPKIDKLIGQLDYFFSPNLGFQSLTLGCKHILTVHDLSFEIEPKQFSRKRQLWHRVVRPRQQCEQAEKIITPSMATKRDIIKMYGVASEKIHVISPGLPASFSVPTFDSEFVRRKYHLPSNFILTLGTIEPRKNLDTLLSAFQLFKMRTGSRIHLVVAGPRGWKNRQTLKTLRTLADVHEIGYVDSVDKPALYRLAKLFVYPSLYEGFGLPVLEAMGSGVPVVTSAVSALPEVGGGAVYYVNPDNVEDVYLALKRLLSNPSLLQRLHVDGLVQSKRFSWQKSAHDFMALFAE